MYASGAELSSWTLRLAQGPKGVQLFQSTTWRRKGPPASAAHRPSAIIHHPNPITITITPTSPIADILCTRYELDFVVKGNKKSVGEIKKCP
jgi:hypothetical protein